MELSAKITLLFNSLNVLILVVYGLVSVRTQVAEKIKEIDTELAIAAQSYVRVVGEGKIDRAFQVGAVRQGSKDIGTVPKEDYMVDVAFMGQYASDLGLAYLYSMTIADGKAKYVLDGAPQEEIDEGNFKYPMDDYPDASPMLFAAWEKWIPTVDEYKDSFGSFRSYFMPFATKAGNKVIVGADMQIDEVKRRIRGVVVSQVMVFAAIIAVGFVATFFFSRVVAKRMIGRAYDHLFSVPISQKRQTSMKHKYIAFSSFLFLIILSTGVIAFVALMRPIVRENIKTELMWTVERERRKLEAELNSEITLVKRMANSILIRRHLHDPSDQWLRTMAFEELAGYNNAFAPNDVFWISDRDKKYYFKDKYIYTLEPTEKGSEWYDPALNMTNSFQMKVNFDVGLKKTMLWINAPVFDNRRLPVGLVGVGIHLDDFIKSIYQSYQGTNELCFFNVDGEITGARNIGLIENKVNIADHLGNTGKEILTATKELSRINGIHCFETKNERTAIAIDSIPIIGWYVVVVHHFTLGEFLPIGMTMLFIAVMAIIFVCFVVLNLFVVKMLNPLNSLIKSLSRILVDWDLRQHKEGTGEIETLGEFVTMAIIDPLTTVYNRRYFDGQLKKLLNSLSRSGGELSLLLIDVDHFKKYNDYYGHDAGDSCLKMIAAILAQCVKREDDFVARYGGEEFAVVLPHTDQAGAKSIAENLLENLQKCNIPHEASDTANHVTVSIGGATGSVHQSHHAKAYIKCADKALYESKKMGRNRYTFIAF
jgi:diguanylate cyclase (GGDEF)-like protein